MIYLDNAATTFPRPEEVLQCAERVNRMMSVNAGRGSYPLARQAADVIEQTRGKLLALAGNPLEYHVIYSASVTLAIHQILWGLRLSAKSKVYVSPFEHNAFVRNLMILQEKIGFELLHLPLKEQECEIDLARLHDQFQMKRPDVVCMSHVSNVTGYILPVEEICREAKEKQAITIVDGAQAFGLVPVDLKKMQADFYLFAGHKTLCGLFGAAGFFCQEAAGRALEIHLAGGTGSDSLNGKMPNRFPERLEAGSKDIGAIAALGAAVDWISTQGNLLSREQRLAWSLASGLRDIYGIEIYYPERQEKVKSFTGIVSFNVAGFQAWEVGKILEEDGIAVRTGYHCSPWIHERLGTVQTYGGEVRCSFGWANTEQDVEQVIQSVRMIV